MVFEWFLITFGLFMHLEASEALAPLRHVKRPLTHSMSPACYLLWASLLGPRHLGLKTSASSSMPRPSGLSGIRKGIEASLAKAGESMRSQVPALHSPSPAELKAITWLVLSPF